ncbi:DUF5703 family protein [Nocardioides malaquae]|uniref:DUF5703 family protein n=1 Tax=Nocardioides malaquae TaxID=2773426 RepID=UPI0029D41195|nr:DUF5703 family protein [Nocardioides malaquae]
MVQARTRLSPGVEWEVETVVYPGDFSRSAVRRLLVERAETGGWELSRLRIRPDGSRAVVLKRKVIRQRRSFSFV